MLDAVNVELLVTELVAVLVEEVEDVKVGDDVAVALADALLVTELVVVANTDSEPYTGEGDPNILSDPTSEYDDVAVVLDVDVADVVADDVAVALADALLVTELVVVANTDSEPYTGEGDPNILSDPTSECDDVAVALDVDVADVVADDVAVALADALLVTELVVVANNDSDPYTGEGDPNILSDPTSECDDFAVSEAVALAVAVAVADAVLDEVAVADSVTDTDKVFDIETLAESVNAAVIVVEDDSNVDSVEVPDGDVELVTCKEEEVFDDAVVLIVDDLEDIIDTEALVDGEFETLGLAVDVATVDCESLADGDFEVTGEREAEGQAVPESVRLFEAVGVTEEVVDFDLMPVTVEERVLTGVAVVDEEIELDIVELDETDAEIENESMTVNVPYSETVD